MRKIFYRVVSIVLYLKLILTFKGRDYYEILKLLRLKLERTKLYWELFSNQEKAPIKIKEMEESVDILNRLIDDNYEVYTSNENQTKIFNLKDQDKNRLFDILKNNMFSWWE